jgi:hypothetical protein
LGRPAQARGIGFWHMPKAKPLGALNQIRQRQGNHT